MLQGHLMVVLGAVRHLMREPDVLELRLLTTSWNMPGITCHAVQGTCTGRLDTARSFT